MVSQAGPVQWTGRQAVMTLPEQIDVSNAGQIGEALLSAIGHGPTSLIADMSATISCDYAGAEAVVRAYRRTIRTGTELRLVVTAQTVRGVLGTSGLDRLVAIYPSLESATAARTPAVIQARLGGLSANGQAPPDHGGRRGASTAVAPAVLARMVDAFPDGVALADDHGMITLTNLRLDAMFGYPHEEVLGHPVEFLVPSDLQDGHRSLRVGYDRAPRTRPMGDAARLVGLCKDGTTFPAQISLSPVPTAAGKFTFVVIRDVTETRRVGDLAALARAAVTAEQEHRGRGLLDTIITALFDVGLSLQATIDPPAEATRQRIAEALGHLDEVIGRLRDTAFTGGSHQDTARVRKPGHDHPGG
jgi:anti-anti-sigma factor